MKRHLTPLVTRHNKTERSLSRSQPRARGRSAHRAMSGALAIALAAAAMCLAIIVPAPAYAATNPVEIVNGFPANGSLRVDVMWGSTSPTQGAFLWTDNSSASQEFNLLATSGGFFQIQARHSGQCLMLDWRGGTYVNGTGVIQFPCQASDYWPSQWYTTTISIGCGPNCFPTTYVLIKNRYTNKCLDARNSGGGVPPQTAVIQQWDCASPGQWNIRNQLWNFATATSVPAPIIH